MIGAGQINAALRRVPKGVVWALGALPLVWLIWQGATGGLGVDPVKRIEHALGLYALQFLVASLAVTPLLRMTGITVMRFRRSLGVWAFLYAALHLGVWLGLDIQLRWSEIARDLTRRPYIIAGALALACMVPLAITARDSSIRRLGAVRWRRLHRLAYLAVILGAVHFVLSVKAWPPEPLIYGAIVVFLLVFRLFPRRRGGEDEKKAGSVKKPLAGVIEYD